MSSRTLPLNAFRASTGAIIINQEGKVLALERLRIKDAWQLPQGGLEENEKPLDGVYREIREETGLESRDLQLLAEHPEWLAYELPEEMRSGKYGRGQVQKWFMFRLNASDDKIRLDTDTHQEFAAWQWMTFHELIGITIPFRKSVYQRVADYFSDYLAH